MHVSYHVVADSQFHYTHAETAHARSDDPTPYPPYSTKCMGPHTKCMGPHTFCMEQPIHAWCAQYSTVLYCAHLATIVFPTVAPCVNLTAS